MAEHSSENAVLVEDVQPAPESGDGTAPEEMASPSVTLSFVDMLVMAGMLAKEQAYVAQETARREKLPLWRVLVRDGLVVSQDLAALTALHRGLTMVDLRNQTIDHDAVAILTEQVSRKYSVLPIRVHDGTLTVAMPDPTDLQVLQDLSALTDLVIDPVVATAEDVLEHIDVSYRLIENTSEESTSGTASASAAARVNRDPGGPDGAPRSHVAARQRLGGGAGSSSRPGRGAIPDRLVGGGHSVAAHGSQCLHQLSGDDTSPRCGAEGLRVRDGRGAGPVYLRRGLQHVCADRLPRTQQCLRDLDDDRLCSPDVPGRCGPR